MYGTGRPFRKQLSRPERGHNARVAKPLRTTSSKAFEPITTFFSSFFSTTAPPILPAGKSIVVHHGNRCSSTSRRHSRRYTRRPCPNNQYVANVKHQM